MFWFLQILITSKQPKILLWFWTAKVGNYFSLKDWINKFYRSCIIYKFQSPGDLDTQHIIEMELQLFVRFNEHTRPTNSAVFSVIEQCNICQNHNNIFGCFDVIKFCKTWFHQINFCLCYFYPGQLRVKYAIF